jgi:hypothetical protein
VVIKKVSVEKSQLSEAELVQLKKVRLLVDIEFWRWKYKVIEKKWQKRN